MPVVACFCADVPTLVTRTRLVLVRHMAEARRTSNTGRMVARAIPACQMVDFGAKGSPLDLTGELGEDAWVLAPGGGPPPIEIGTLVILDGSWSQVRTMRRRIPPLAALRSFSLQAPTMAPQRVRRTREPSQLATIEAVAEALEVLGEPAPAQGLRSLFAAMAARMHLLRYPPPGHFESF